MFGYTKKQCFQVTFWGDQNSKDNSKVKKYFWKSLEDNIYVDNETEGQKDIEIEWYRDGEIDKQTRQTEVGR